MNETNGPNMAQAATAAPPRCRPFRLVDVMVFIAAVAPVCLYLRVGLLTMIRNTFDFMQRNGMWSTLTTRPELVLVPLWGLFIVTLICLSLAYLIVRLLPPRPRLRVMVGQPGVVALGATFLAALATTLRSSWFTLVLTLLAIPIAWSVLAARGRWRSESGWIDAFGKAVGVGWCLASWIILLVLSWFFGNPPNPVLKRPWF
jgi:hypothetical protein